MIERGAIHRVVLDALEKENKEKKSLDTGMGFLGPLSLRRDYGDIDKKPQDLER